MTLPTTGVRWGISMEVSNEAQLGALLGYASLMGAQNIAWQALAPASRGTQRRTPARRHKNERGSTFDVLRALPDKFERSAAIAALLATGVNERAAASTIVRWHAQKLIRRTAVGRYVRLPDKTELRAVA